MRTSVKRRRGTVAALVAVSLIGIIAVVAIALEGGLLLDEHGRAQAAADAAAMAAAEDLYSNYFLGQGLDPNGTAAKSALSNAMANGYANDGARSVVTVNIPPSSGAYAGKRNYAEVIIRYNQPRGFSSLFGSKDLPVQARAVAQGMWSTLEDGILVLDPTSSGSMSAGGGGNTVVAGTVRTIVDSNSPTAVSVNGGGSLTSPVFDITGVPGTSTVGGSTITGTINSGVPPTPDPLAYLPVPDPNSLTLQSKNGSHYSGQKTVTIDPGVYVGGISISGGVNVIMNPGIYYMLGGGFSYTGTGNLTGSGIMIYNAGTGTNDNVKIAGSGAVNISPPSSGIYQGMTIFQQRDSTTAVVISGNGQMTVGGTFYCQHALLKVNGSGLQNTIGSQYVCYDLILGGNGNVTIDYNAAPHPRTRVITLVE